MRFNRLITLSFITAVLFITACRTKEKPVVPVTPVLPVGHMDVTFNNQMGGKPISFSTMTNINAVGDTYSVNTLKYYITSFSLIKSDSTKVNYPIYKLINARDSSTCVLNLDTIPNGDYVIARFNLGLDSSHNYTGLQTGDLDPSMGMFWDWNTGYKFFIHEGFFLDSNSATNLLLYHYATTPFMITIDIAIPSAIKINGNSRKLQINLDLKTLYSYPNIIKFRDNNIHESLLFGDRGWLDEMRTNFRSAFTLGGVQ